MDAARKTGSSSSRSGLLSRVGRASSRRFWPRIRRAFRVRWDDGRTSIFAPSAGVARIERRKRERVKA